MHKVVFFALAAVLSASCRAGFCGDAFDPLAKFRLHVSDSLVKPFAADLGGLIGAADFSSARTMDYPGLDIGAVGVLQSRPGQDDLILRNAGVKAFGLGLVQGAAALPFRNTELAARGGAYSNFYLMGIGLRHAFFRSRAPAGFVPDISGCVFYDSIKYTYFTARHISADLVASFELPVVKPFIGAGYDRTRVAVKGVSSELDGADAIAARPRYTIGLRLAPFPLMYVFASCSMLQDRTGFQMGAGARF